MRAFSLALLAALMAAPAVAQTAPATLGDQYVPAPWWMREPVIASIGYVRVELPSNRANFSASFQVVDRSAADATGKAADKVRELAAALQTIGAEKVRIVTTFNTQPLYEQYRDKDGNKIDNQRADKIERYQVSAEVSIEVRDTELLEQAYATVIAAKPTSTTPVYFRLDPENDTKTALYSQAVKDAARRAHLAADDAGAKIGGVKLIDPTGRACQTDVLAGWPSYGQGLPQPRTVDRKTVQEVVVTGSGMARGEVSSPSPMSAVMDVAAAPPPPGAELTSEALAMKLPIQPPLQEMTAQACVVYGLSS